MKQMKNIFYYLVLSIAASFLLLVLAFFGSSNGDNIGMHDRLFVSVVFIASCIFGISLAMYPGWCKQLIKHGDRNSNRGKIQKTTRKYQGHHPDCSKFKSHTIKIKEKTLCAGCIGLTIGSIISIFLMIIYVITTNDQPLDLFYFLIILGLIIISLTYIEIMLPIRHSIIHVISNIFLVVSFFLIIISIFEITDSKIYGAISILLSFLWLDTRIQLSNWRHTLICKNCGENCKMY